MHLISASRKTDIPAFYVRWFMNRVRAEYCHWVNPYSGQVYRVSLKPEDCAAIIFWTRDPEPILPHLRELTDRGLKYYFLVTLLGYPSPLETHAVAMNDAVRGFRKLAEHLSPEFVHWKYDPIVFSDVTPAQYHIDRFGAIAERLRGYTQRCLYSWLTMADTTRENLAGLSQEGHITFEPPSRPERHALAARLAEIASANGMQLHSCFSEDYASVPSVCRGSCVDLEVLRRLTGNPQLNLVPLDQMRETWGYQRKLDGNMIRRGLAKAARFLSRKPQAPHCRCQASIDIGSEDTCLYSCSYCLATRSRASASENYRSHDPLDSLLVRPENLRGVDLDQVAEPFPWSMVV